MADDVKDRMEERVAMAIRLLIISYLRLNTTHTHTLLVLYTRVGHFALQMNHNNTNDDNKNILYLWICWL